MGGSVLPGLAKDAKIAPFVHDELTIGAIRPPALIDYRTLASRALTASQSITWKNASMYPALAVAKSR